MSTVDQGRARLHWGSDWEMIAIIYVTLDWTSTGFGLLFGGS